MTRSSALACAGLLFVASPCPAQDAGAAAPKVQREGFLIGFSLGAGAVAPDPCTDCGSSASYEVHIGGTVNRRFAFMVESAGLGSDTADHQFLVAAAQWWPDPVGRLWVRGGLGIGSQVSGDTSNAGVARLHTTVLGEGGLEVVRHGRFTMDLQVRGAATKQPDRWGRSGSVNVGFNWY